MIEASKCAINDGLLGLGTNQHDADSSHEGQPCRLEWTIGASIVGSVPEEKKKRELDDRRKLVRFCR
jgi:hypothetical protein